MPELQHAGSQPRKKRPVMHILFVIFMALSMGSVIEMIVKVTDHVSGHSSVKKYLTLWGMNETETSWGLQEPIPLHGERMGASQRGYGGGRDNNITIHTTRAKRGGVQEEDAEVWENCTTQTPDDWPLMKLETEKAWPNVGWKTMSLQDADFRSTFKFYLLEDVPFYTRQTIECFKEVWGVPSVGSKDYKIYDDRLTLVQRLYIPEMAIFPVLFDHPMRTLDPEEAQLFIIGWSPVVAWNLKKRGHQAPDACTKYPLMTKGNDWHDKIADYLTSSKYYQRKAGLDHVIFFTKYATGVSPKLREVLDGGSIVASTDRYFWSIYHNLPNPFVKGSVLIIPYVASTYIDDPQHPNVPISQRSKDRWYYFRGVYNRRGGTRSVLVDIAKHLTGADFADFRFGGPDAALLKKSADEMRHAAVCPAPQGDAVTSGRMFESLGAGCVPLMSTVPKFIRTDLPFPSLIAYDNLMLFTDNYPAIHAIQDGVTRFGRYIDDKFGPNASQADHERLDCMQRQGRRIFRKHYSYFRNPLGVTESLLFEAWMHLQKWGLVDGPHGEKNVRGEFKRWVPVKSRGRMRRLIRRRLMRRR